MTTVMTDSENLDAILSYMRREMVRRGIPGSVAGHVDNHPPDNLTFGLLWTAGMPGKIGPVHFPFILHFERDTAIAISEVAEPCLAGMEEICKSGGIDGVVAYEE